MSVSRDLVISRLADVDVKYYADGENGLSLKLDLDIVRKEYNIPPFKGLDDEASAESASEPKKDSKNKRNRKGRR